ncbi:hypothetical protein ACA910_013763 [Epithemia clementina (nom. ined.)]
MEAMNDPLFVETHSSEARKTTPLPILAIARHAAQATEMWFPTNTMELVIPVHRISGAPLNPITILSLDNLCSLSTGNPSFRDWQFLVQAMLGMEH